MQTDRRIEIEEIERALDTIAEWLIACYGRRITAISLILEARGHPAHQAGAVTGLPGR